MKGLFKTTGKTLLILSLILLFSCEKDLYESQIQNKTLDKISFEQFKRETGLKDFKKSITISTIPKEGSSLRITQTSYKISDFDIDLEIINKLVVLEETTYTFKIEPKIRYSKNIFNLIVFKRDNDWKMCILELIPTPDNIQDLKYGLTDKFEGNIRKLYDETVTTSDNIGLRISLSHHCTHTGSCSADEGGYCDLCSLCITVYNHPVFDFSIAPPSTPGDAGGYGIGFTSGGAPLVTLSGISFEANLPSTGDYYVLNENMSNFYNSLDANQQNWADVYNQTYNQSIIQYLINNNWSQESDLFSRQLISAMAADPSLHFDAEASSKSPANIDRTSIDGSTPEGQKFNAVYDELTKSEEFRSLFINLFENNDRFSVKFQIGFVANGANGNTDTDLANPTLNTITISPQYLFNSNKLEIAKTIIHECIHAFLNIKMVDPSVGMSIPSINNMEFCDVINQQYNNFTPGQNQHNFIYNYMLPTMETILSQVKDFLVSSANNQVMLNDVVVRIPYDSSPPTAFVWADYYHNLSLQGLQNCQFFQNEIATITYLGGIRTITNVINQSLMQSYIQYMDVGHWNISN